MLNLHLSTRYFKGRHPDYVVLSLKARHIPVEGQNLGAFATFAYFSANGQPEQGLPGGHP